jgi:molecular chaperone DnaK
MKGASNVAVFDWGGGTLDVSLLSYDGKIVREWAVAGKRLGGDDIDEMLARYFHSRIMQDKEITMPVRFDELPPKAKDQIIERSENAKIALSSEETASIRLMDYCNQSLVSAQITREEFAGLISAQIREAEGVLREAADKAHISLAQLDAILMVGGSCAMQPILERLKEIGKREMNKADGVNVPDEVQWAIAHGAAILSQKNPSYRLERALGVCLADNSFYPVFKIGDAAPSEVITPRFGVIEDSSRAIFVFADDKGNNLSFTDDEGRMEQYASIEAKGFGEESIALEAWIDDDMIANISLRSDHMDKPISIRFNKLPFSYHINQENI